MKLLSGLIGFIIAVIALCFALANRQTATLSLWPFGVEVDAPLYLLSLGTLFVGLLIGALVVWLSMIPHRLRTRRLHHDIAALNAKIVELQQTVLAPNRMDEHLHAPAKLNWRFWEPKL